MTVMDFRSWSSNDFRSLRRNNIIAESRTRHVHRAIVFIRLNEIIVLVLFSGVEWGQRHKLPRAAGPKRNFRTHPCVVLGRLSATCVRVRPDTGKYDGP